MSKEWMCRVCHKLIMDGKCDCDALPPVRSDALLAAWLEEKRKKLVYACSEKDGQCRCNMCDRERARLQIIEQVIAKLNELMANDKAQILSEAK